MESFIIFYIQTRRLSCMFLKGVGRSNMPLFGISDSLFPIPVLSSFLHIVMRVTCMPGSGLLVFGVMRKLLVSKGAAFWMQGYEP